MGRKKITDILAYGNQGVKRQKEKLRMLKMELKCFKTSVGNKFGRMKVDQHNINRRINKPKIIG